MIYENLCKNQEKTMKFELINNNINIEYNRNLLLFSFV